MLDNGSTDGTVEFLCEQPDVTVLRTSVPYRTHENLMKRYMVRRHSTGKWNLFVDIDELFDYPASDCLGLPDLLAYLTQHGYTAAIAQMLDMFPDGALADSPAEVADLESSFPYFDISGISKRPYEYDTDPSSTLQSHHGGIRLHGFRLREPAYEGRADLRRRPDRDLRGVAPRHTRAVRRHLLRPAALPVQPSVLREGRGGRPYPPIRPRRVARVPRLLGGARVTIRSCRSIGRRRSASDDVDQLVELGFLQVSDQYRRWVVDHRSKPS